MNMRKGDIIELSIHNMAYGGRGLGRLDGLVVFVKGGVPGDRVRARVFRKKRDYAEAGILELLAPSPHRVTAPCPYSGYCGGCTWQHVAYERQLQYKRDHVRESLERIGGLEDSQVLQPIPSERVFGYRNKMEFSFSDRRWFLPHEMERRPIEGDFALGLHVPGTFHKVIDMEACLLQRNTGNLILKEVKAYVKDSGIPVYGLRSHQGFWRFLMVRHSTAFDQWMVNMVTSEDRQEAVLPLAEELCRTIPEIRTVVNNINNRKAAIALGQSERVLTGEGDIQDRIGPFTFRISANSFFQTNAPGAHKLYDTVARYARLTGTERVLDLYSGTGTIPIFLAHKARSVTGIEISEDAVLDARKNCEDNGIPNCRFLCGDMREKLLEIEKGPDVVVIDPPRAGMHKDVLARVLELAAKRVIYVSCNPVTLARDMGLMKGAYELLEIQPVDMFPHTYHIEAVACLRLRKHVSSSAEIS